MPTDTLLKITKEELSQLISSAIEQKLFELLGDPEENLSIRDDLERRLLRQKTLVAKGKRGKKLHDVKKQLGQK